VTEPPTVPLWELVQTAHLAGRRFAEAFASAGLTPAQFGVLASLVDGDDLSPADLARAVYVRPQSMGRLVADMVEQGLVTRTGPGGRGRRTGLALTDRGRRAVAEARPAAYALSTPEALHLTPSQVEDLVELLGIVRRALQTDPPPTDGAIP
jgi:DNA-binding MarR family transcriptional regulator